MSALVQGSDEWHEHRAKHFNASDAAAMLGISKYKTRQELLNEKASGFTKEIDEATQKRFDDGHRFEAMAREWVPEIAGEEVFPMVVSKEIDGLPLSASLDGVSIDDGLTWEHKTLNFDLAEALDEGEIPEEYRPQMEQGLLLTGAARCLFMASKGEKRDVRWKWYESDPELRKALLAGWAQFAIDLDGYQHVEPKPEPVGRAPENLPALHIEVAGMVTASNLREFKEHALAVFGAINRDLQTDKDFADADKTTKWCKEVETKLDAAKQHALSQTKSIDELFRTIDEIKGEARSVRLELEKLVEARKKAIRFEIAKAGKDAIDAHVAAINKQLQRVRLPEIKTDFAAVMKSKKTVAALRSAVDDELARLKIEVNSMAVEMQRNINTLDELAEDYKFLFSDLQQIIMKPNDDFTAVVKLRIAEHKEAEEKRLEAERERIRIEEEAKATAKAQQEAQTQAPVSAPVVAYSNTKSTQSSNSEATMVRWWPSDDEIINVLANHYSVSTNAVRYRLQEMECIKIAFA